MWAVALRIDVLSLRRRGKSYAEAELVDVMQRGTASSGTETPESHMDLRKPQKQVQLPPATSLAFAHRLSRRYHQAIRQAIRSAWHGVRKHASE